MSAVYNGDVEPLFDATNTLNAGEFQGAAAPKQATVNGVSTNIESIGTFVSSGAPVAPDLTLGIPYRT